MRKLLFSPRARLDLEAIWDYSAERWDMQQADACIRRIHAVCTGLASGDIPGQSASEVRSGYRRQVAGSHVILYQEDEEAIVVIRILHQRMDVPSHL